MKKQLKTRLVCLLLCLVMSVGIFAGCGEPNTYEVTVNVDGVVTTTYVAEGKTVTATAPQKEGYTFDGFFVDGVQIQVPYTVNGDVTIDAKYTKIAPPAQQPPQEEQPKEVVLTAFEKQLATALKTYLESDDFKQYLSEVQTTQERLPLQYLKYIDGCYISSDFILQTKTYMGYINELIEDGKITHKNFTSTRVYDYSSKSSTYRTGWASVTDYLYTWTHLYNIYMQWCKYNDVADTSWEMYKPMIATYLTEVDTYLSKSANAHEFKYNDQNITTGEIYKIGYEIFVGGTYPNNGLTKDKINTYDRDWFTQLLDIVKEETGTDAGHKDFLTKVNQAKVYSNGNSYTAAELKNRGNTLWMMWKNFFPATDSVNYNDNGVPFGHTAADTLPMIAANLGITNATPYCDSVMLAYYDKEDGEFTTAATMPNWNGFTGRPLCATLYKDNAKYDVNYEKTMQGYYPYQDNLDTAHIFDIDELVNLDRFCDSNFDHTLQPAPSMSTTYSAVNPQYALLTAMAHGIDMTKYKKVVASDGETGEETFDLIAAWADHLQKDGENFVIDNFDDMAVAVAYLAKAYGIDCPSPVGQYDQSLALIKL